MRNHGSGSHLHASDAIEDTLDSEDRDRLEAAIAEADAELDRGEGIPGELFLAELRARRHA